jgi:hypothetical protein
MITNLAKNKNSHTQKSIVKLESWMKGLAPQKKKHCETWVVNEGFSHTKEKHCETWAMNEGFTPKKSIVKLELWMKGLATHQKKALWNLSHEWRV